MSDPRIKNRAPVQNAEGITPDSFLGYKTYDDPATIRRTRARKLLLARQELGMGNLEITIAFALHTGLVGYDEVDKALKLSPGSAENTLGAYYKRYQEMSTPPKPE